MLIPIVLLLTLGFSGVCSLLGVPIFLGRIAAHALVVYRWCLGRRQFDIGGNPIVSSACICMEPVGGIHFI